MRAIRATECTRGWLLGVVLSLAVSTSAVAQGNESSSTASQAEGPQQGDAVEIGAGSTAAVTTGSSGPDSSSNPTVPPVAGSFSIRPPQDEFAGPGMLPIRAPQKLRCDLIDEANARQRCQRAGNQG